ncbi:2-succinyl-6-hydroxy-2,4-cyclohexadiene-1-carboxylate synthase [Candidatus Lokiarchaeum ossiferum]|uniref:2-succinyl-6-hydroxy-2, 4-cyclohexadiene-1-carboxylate synthase n=1 Tax=Candidatus Lokiarchaeum ossiferum TaxID=2951803 RepID=A0ABY6HUN8_9ARCH|nr:2-succinyl-6-hydroxy-2,4-cyclohexadiene-1-carboxylate synthase [Candidatus Lokiarchaeum sp. B-35]
MTIEQWQQFDLEINGINLHYTRTGGNKPILILLHGFTDYGLTWTRIAETLESDYDIIMPDARGHGKSTMTESGFDVPTMAEDIAHLILKLRILNPIIMGHSMGGQIATLLGANHPNLISKIILEDPAYLLSKSSRFISKFIGFLFKSMVKMNMKKNETQIEDWCRKRNSHWHETEIIQWAHAQKAFATEKSLSMMNLTTFPSQWVEVFPKINCPSLLIIPEKGMLRIKSARKIQPKFKNCSIEYIKNAGHNVRRDNYPEFIQAVNTFLESN